MLGLSRGGSEDDHTPCAAAPHHRPVPDWRWGVGGAGWEHTLHLGLSSRVQEKQQRCRMSHPLLTLGAPQPPFWRRKVELHPPQVGFSA